MQISTHTPWPIAMLLMMALLTGCSQPRTVQVQTMADPAMTFPQPDAALVHVAIVRLQGDADDPEPIRPDRERLSLPERNLLAEVERGVRDAGFATVSRSEAEFILFCSSQVVTGERRVYRRVPVHETHHGSIHTRRGWRTFHGTTTSEVVVPETRAFTNRIITITVHRVSPDGEWPQPDDASAVWMGRLVGDVADLEDRPSRYVTALFGSWGRTDRRAIRVTENGR
jgi:hypothetical protein